MKSLLLCAIPLLLVSIIPAFAQSEQYAVLETSLGEIVIEFFPDDAPKHVENFITLTEQGFYDGTKFHRVIPGFMIQGGDPNTKGDDASTWGQGGPEYSLDAEFNDIKHNRGIVSMARSNDPNSAGSQFFIVHQDSTFLDEQYTVFGRIATQESFDTLDAIAALETNNRDVPLELDQAIINSVNIVDSSQIDELMKQDDPERVAAPLVGTDSPYTHEGLDITFIAPEGWLIQEPPKTHPQVPDLVLVGSRVGGINPTISFSTVPVNDRTLDDYIAQINESLEPIESSGQLTTLSVDDAQIAGHTAHIRNAVGLFVTQNSTVDVQFREINLLAHDKIYTITYTNSLENFEQQLPRFETAMDSLSIDEPFTSGNTQSSDKDTQTMLDDMDDKDAEGGGCLIATAAYGTELAPQVQLLREIRDNTLLSTESGTSFMSGFNSIYYSFSPTIADLERQNPAFQEAVRVALTPMLSTLSIMSYAQEGSEASVLALGISVIMLNLGMYIVAPAFAISRLAKK